MGPNNEPCGTPFLMSRKEEVDSSSLTHCVRQMLILLSQYVCSTVSHDFNESKSAK